MDPDAADAAAVELSGMLPEEPEELVDLGPGVEEDAGGLQITGLRTVGGMSGMMSRRFEGLFGSEDSSSEDEEGFGEDETGRDEMIGRLDSDYEKESSMVGVGRRRSGKSGRPSTTQAKERKPLDDDDDDDADLGTALESQRHLGEGPFADPVEMEDEESEEDEIRPRRTS